MVVDLREAHSVGEWRDVEHVQQNCLRCANLGTGLNKLEISGDFNRTTSDLGWDTKSLEERGLSGFHTSVTGRHINLAVGVSRLQDS